MNTTNSSLEKHAAALGLAGEDAAPIQRVKPPVDKADKVLMGIGCCLLATCSAVLSVWMIVPTVVVSGIGAALLVRHLNVANSLPPRQWTAPEAELDGEWLLREMEDERRKRNEKWNRDIVRNPMFRRMYCNLFHHSYRRD